ncbi:hypothetical protein AB1Y20_020138 [Prymnesium parvum]|uniref:Uncharacterized protein n=1 Tax=Prymnesium parvum TaxID=97485 RepID=A0AB34JUC3_PRYPA
MPRYIAAFAGSIGNRRDTPSTAVVADGIFQVSWPAIDLAPPAASSACVSRMRAPFSCRRDSVSEWTVAMVLAVAVTSVWRGAWLILDAFLLPQQPPLSAAASLLLGALLFIFCRVVQPAFISWACNHPHRMIWLMDALYSYIGMWSCALVWRGAWNLWDTALGRGLAATAADLQLALNGFLSHAVGLAVLGMLGALRSLNAPPMLLCCDTAAPIFGASVRCTLQPFERIRRGPQPMPLHDWMGKVGLPMHASPLSGTELMITSGCRDSERTLVRKEAGSNAEVRAEYCSCTILRRAPDGSAIPIPVTKIRS